MVQEVSYLYFAERVIIRNKRKDKVKKRIKEALKIIEKDNTIIKFAKQTGDFFKIEYNPLSESEIKDLELAKIQNSILNAFLIE